MNEINGHDAFYDAIAHLPSTSEMQRREAHEQQERWRKSLRNYEMWAAQQSKNSPYAVSGLANSIQPGDVHNVPEKAREAQSKTSVPSVRLRSKTLLQRALARLGVWR